MFFKTAMKNKYVLPVLSGVFLLVILIYLANLYHCAKELHGYIIADWLINFSGGFVRRGLGGSFTLHLSDLFGIPPQFMVNVIQLFFYLFYMIVLFLLLKRKKIDFWFVILLLSPVTLLFPVIDVCGVGRKEIILFSIFGFYLFCLNKGWLKSYALVATFSFALFVGTLFHELIFFYTPYFLVAAYIHGKSFRGPALFIVAGSLLAIIPLFLFGKSIDSTAICGDLMRRGMDERICSGILTGPNTYTIRYIFQQARSSNYHLTYTTCILLGVLPFLFFIYFSQSRVTIKEFLIAFVFLFLFSAPLFFLAFDWGRWINIHFILILFTCTLLLKDQVHGDNWKNEYLVIPSLWKTHTTLPKVFSNILFLGLCFSYLTFWQMKHFDAFPVFYLEKYENFGAEISKSLDIANELFIEPYEFL